MLKIPNILTSLRGLLALLVILLLWISPDKFYTYLLFVFIVAAITDVADGAIARRVNNVSDFGKVFDPLFDKVVVFIFLIIIYPLEIISPTIILLLILRDLVIDALRSFLLSRGAVIPAIITAKAKTAVTFIMISSALLELSSLLPAISFHQATVFLSWAALGFSYISAVQYSVIFLSAYKKPK
jgi:CDP-diacylglycerol---glycerol-3-phosphate 3-phosphatidyltransferase